MHKLKIKHRLSQSNQKTGISAYALYCSENFQAEGIKFAKRRELAHLFMH